MRINVVGENISTITWGSFWLAKSLDFHFDYKVVHFDKYKLNIQTTGNRYVRADFSLVDDIKRK